MTCFGLGAFYMLLKGFFIALLQHAVVFTQGFFVLFVYAYFEDFLRGGQGLDVVWPD